MQTPRSTEQLAQRVMQRCDFLASFSEEPHKLTRRFATPALNEAMSHVEQWMAAAGMSTRRDNVGNLIGTYPAAEPGAKTLLLGSHLDSVRDAGRYDGPLGVLVALACVERLHEHGQRLPFAIDIVAFADEEGTRFHTAYLGSQAFVGAFDTSQLALTDQDGISMADAILAFGGNPTAIAQDRRSPDSLIGYCEVHIEQGPVLESRDLPVSVVTAIAGQSRFLITINGVAGHAGTVPMDLRYDALCAAAEIILAAEQLGSSIPGLVVTVGQLTIPSSASNVIPGRVMLTLDVRHQTDDIRETTIDNLKHASAQVAEKRGVTIGWERLLDHPCVPCDQTLTRHLAQAIVANGLPVYALQSGAGHDGTMLAQITPIAMLFVRCAGGISHNPAESVLEGDVAVAIDVLGTMVSSIATT